MTLVWSESFPTREEALAAELQIKGWSRAKKEALIAGDWARLHELAKAPGARASTSLSTNGDKDGDEGGIGPSGSIERSSHSKTRSS